MAITHSIAHTLAGPPSPPSRLLTFLNHHLSARYTTDTGTFVTAFYGVYDPATRLLTYASAGHNPPRVRHDGAGRTVYGSGRIRAVDRAGSLPLGIDEEVVYEDTVEHLASGDFLLLYTDGITEARDPENNLFGVERLDEILDACDGDAPELVNCILDSVNTFTRGRPPNDDRTLLAAKVH